jgi:hypothetical protein
MVKEVQGDKEEQEQENVEPESEHASSLLDYDDL